ncbi:hypothetical protein Tco_1455704 [Tanacetum coccineum]
MSDSTGGMNDLDDMEDMEMIMQQLWYEQSLQEQEAESSNRRNYIYRERDIAEEHHGFPRMLGSIELICTRVDERKLSVIKEWHRAILVNICDKKYPNYYALMSLRA